jgi:hypothetical protein
MGDNSLYHVLALISKNHKYNKMKSSFIYLLFLYIIFILWGCGEKEKTGNLGETELYFDERLSSIWGITNILYKSNSKVIFSQKYT